MKLEKGGGSQNVKPTCATCGKRNYGECIRGTESYYGSGKEEHKVRDCHIIVLNEVESSKVNKLLLMFQKRIFQRPRIVSMLSNQVYQSRMRMMMMMVSPCISIFVI